jgi:4-hydroxyacetophenone monooxygenase
MMPNPMYHERVPPGERWAIRHLPFYGRWLRFLMTYPGVALGTSGYRVDPDYVDDRMHAINAAHAKRAEHLESWLMSFLDDRPDLVEKVIPDYPAMGKRILQDNGSWMRCLKRTNVELVRTAIDRVVPEGVVTVDGRVYEADVICYATGFRHNEFLAPMEVTGRGGVSLREQWGDEPTAHLGITIPRFPNFFMLYGPGTNLAHSASLFMHTEFQVRYAMDAVHRVLSAGARTIEVREEAHNAYVERYEAEISQLVWAHPSIEHSHYKNPAGKVYTLSPWPLDEYWEWTKAVDPADYVIT